jgi:hypothetical protein
MQPMYLENEHGFWALQWFPAVFDAFTVVLLVTGCLLLWLSFRPAKQVIFAATRTGANDAEASRPAQYAVQEPSNYRADWLTRSDEPESEPIKAVDQNSYAGRVASAMRKASTPSGKL